MVDEGMASLSTRLLVAVFCPSCRFSFVPKIDTNSCPECGEAVDLVAGTDFNTRILSPPELAVSGATSVLPASKATEVDELIGQTIDRYACEALLGAGAMGRVYLARHVDLHRSCALKILPPQLVQGDAAYVGRFENEGRAAAALNHPNIVTIHAIGEDRGYHFLEMEFVAGRSLRKLVEDDGPQDPVRATSLTLRVAEGLAAAHLAGILHRDLKPDNVMMTHNGVPKITDFGLAKRVVLSEQSSEATELVGTPPFMAPELFQQQQATPASDVYALGVCYFFLLTGRLPFAAPVLSELIRQVTNDPLPTLRREFPMIPLEMSECLQQLLSKAAENRPRSGVEAAQLLQAVLGESEDLDQLMQLAFAHQSGVRWMKKENQYRVELELGNGRGQLVLVEPSQHAAADRTLRISSVCCSALSVYFEPALRLNSEILHGALAIAEIDGEDHFVMVDNYPRATVDPEEIRRSVLEVAHRADSIEKLLTGLDRN
jgi:eukaryotic-like serine/threonine-protein kinase